MGTASWVLAGLPGSMTQSFGTTCHGAGRMMSRTAAVKLAAGRRIDQELDALGIIARARGFKGLAEEQPAAYKDVDQVVEVVDKAGISKKVARLRPVGCDQGLIRKRENFLKRSKTKPRIGHSSLDKFLVMCAP